MLKRPNSIHDHDSYDHNASNKYVRYDLNVTTRWRLRQNHDSFRKLNFRNRSQGAFLQIPMHRKLGQ